MPISKANNVYRFFDQSICFDVHQGPNYSVSQYTQVEAYSLLFSGVNKDIDGNLWSIEDDTLCREAIIFKRTFSFSYTGFMT